MAPKHRVMAALFMGVLLVVGCAGPTDTEPSARTVVNMSGDSGWPVPSGFNVLLPLTHEQVAEVVRNDCKGRSNNGPARRV